jgi:hypothetical protein
VLRTLGAPERRRLGPSRRQRKAQPEPEPIAVATSRATIVDLGDPLPDAERAAAWLGSAGEPELAAGLAVLNRALDAHRVAATEALSRGVGRSDALVARIGYGAGEEVADGKWTDARELIDPGPRRRRSRIPAAQARLASLLTGRERALTCEELVLRARLDLDEGRDRVAAFQVRIAFDAAMEELPADPAVSAMTDRIEELQTLSATLVGADREALSFALGRLEAALRARAAALAQ